MNCATCGAWSSVAETRKIDRGYSLKRTRVCANGHRFASYEVLEPIYRHSSRDRRGAIAAAEARAFRAKRDAAIRAACETRSQRSVAAEFGLDPARVRAILKASCAS